MTWTRTCACPHSFPICCCFEQIFGTELLVRSRWLSSLAGWPARVDPEEAARVVAEYGRPPAPDPDLTPDAAHETPASVPPLYSTIARMKACEHWETATDCGCGLNRCRSGKGRDGVVSHADCAACLNPQADSVVVQKSFLELKPGPS